MNCTATTAAGSPCRSHAIHNSKFCFIHDPTRVRERAEARRRGGLNRRTRKAVDDDGAPVRLRCVDDVLDTLERALADTWAQENSASRTQSVVRICTAALKAQEVGELEARLATLEKGRGDGKMSVEEWATRGLNS